MRTAYPYLTSNYPKILLTWQSNVDVCTLPTICTHIEDTLIFFPRALTTHSLSKYTFGEMPRLIGVWCFASSFQCSVYPAYAHLITVTNGNDSVIITQEEVVRTSVPARSLLEMNAAIKIAFLQVFILLT